MEFSFPNTDQVTALGIWTWNSRQDLLSVTPNFNEIFEIPATTFKSLSDLLNTLSANDQEKVKNTLDAALENASNFAFKIEIDTPSNQTKLLNFWGGCTVDSEGQREVVTGMCLDITRREGKSTGNNDSPQHSGHTRSILEHSPNAIFVCTSSGIVLYANKAITEMLHASSQESLTGISIKEFIPRQQHNNIEERIKVALKSSSVVPKFEQEFKCLDGSTRIGESVLMPFDWQGATAILAVVNDITEHKQYLGSLQSSEENLKQLIKSTPLSVAMYDNNMNYIACSSKFLEDWWVKDEEMTIDKIVGLNHYDIFEDVKENWKQLHRKCLQGATILKEDDFFIKADGKKEWVRWQNTPWRDTDGNIKGLIIFTEFITERKEAEELIKESQTKLSTIFENLPGMVYGCDNDPDWTITFVSNGSIALTGYEPDEFVRDEDPISFKKIIHPDDVDRVWAEIRHALHNKEIFEIHYRIHTKAGELKFLLERGQGVFDERGNLLSLEGIIIDVTKQKAAEDELRKSETNLAEAQRVASLGSWEWHINAHELLLSDEYYRIFGLTPGETAFTLKNCLEMLHPDDRAKAKAAFQHILKEKKPYQLDARIIRKDNKVRYVTYKADLMVDQNNNPVKLVGSIQDVTKKKEAELALQESENRNRALLSALPDIIFILTVDGTYLDCQVPNRSILLYSPREFLGKNLKDMFDPELADQFLSKFKTAHDTNTTQTLEYSLLMDGELNYFEARIVKYKKDQVLAVVRDITKTRKSEIEAKESEKRFYKAFHISPIPITISHITDGELLEVNEKFLQLVNMPREEVVGSSAIALGFWADDETRTTFVKELKREGKVYGFDGRLRTRDKNIRDVLLSAELINIENKECILLMIFDISERKQAENALISLTQELTSSNHELRQFAYITSHNLRAPVVNIDTLLQFIDKNDLNAPGNTEVFEKIETSVDQLKSTLNDLIQLVALKDSRYEPDEKIYFNDVYDIVTKNLSTQIEGSKATLNVDFQEKSIMLKKPLLESIVQNLISNAIKYKSEKPLVINLRTYRKGEYICMSVEDNGLGIDLPLYKDRIFGMYQRFHEDIEGKGLGLYIIKSQIESMGGKIDIDSAPGQGSTFNVYFKIHKGVKA